VNIWHLKQAARVLCAGGVVAYPTESVYGLGCNPWDGDAVSKLLKIKSRYVEKGLLLIAADISQLDPFVLPMPSTLTEQIHSTWPGPFTWVAPARPEIPDWLTGGRNTIAVRVSAHPQASALCACFDGAIVSTSANLSGRSAARSALGVRIRFQDSVDFILPGCVGPQSIPTEIRDALTGRVLRVGGRAR
jgi:L-threonylcarbamoyladenylate synthase